MVGRVVLGRRHGAQAGMHGGPASTWCAGLQAGMHGAPASRPANVERTLR